MECTKDIKEVSTYNPWNVSHHTKVAHYWSRIGYVRVYICYGLTHGGWYLWFKHWLIVASYFQPPDGVSFKSTTLSYGIPRPQSYMLIFLRGGQGTTLSLVTTISFSSNKSNNIHFMPNSTPYMTKRPNGWYCWTIIVIKLPISDWIKDITRFFTNRKCYLQNNNLWYRCSSLLNFVLFLTSH